MDGSTVNVPARMREEDAANELRRLMAEYGGDVMRLAYAYLREKQRAEDVCQEVFLRVYRHLGRLKERQSEKAWILAVAVNVCRDQLRSPWWKRVLPMGGRTREDAGVGSAEQSAAASESSRELLEQVLSLREPFKTIVLLYYYHDLSTQSIGRMLGISEGTVRSRLHRARLQLREAIEERGEER